MAGGSVQLEGINIELSTEEVIRTICQSKAPAAECPGKLHLEAVSLGKGDITCGNCATAGSSKF
jgi:hypothetical protein